MNRFLLVTWRVLLLLVLASALASPTPADVDARLRAGDPDGALMLLADVRREHPGSAKVEFLSAVALLRAGDPGAAGESLARARQLDPALAFANPADVAAIDRATQDLRRREVGRVALGTLGVGALLVLALGFGRRRHRQRDRKRARDLALDAMHARVMDRDDLIDRDILDARLRTQQDPDEYQEVTRLEHERAFLFQSAHEAWEGRLDPEKVPGPRPTRSPPAPAASPASGFQGVPFEAPPRPRPGRTSSAAPAPLRFSGGSAPGPSSSTPDLATGLLLGQALSGPSTPPEAPAAPAPAPEAPPPAITSWEAPSSLRESSPSNWSSDSSLGSSNSESPISSTSNDSSPPGSDNSASSSSDSGSSW